MSVTTIKTKIRQLIGDNLSSTFDIFTYNTSNIFTLGEANPVDISTVFVNNVERGASEASFDSSTKKVTVNLTLSAGDTVQIDYTYYPNYSNTELLNYIQSALIYLSISNYSDFEYDSTDDEIYPTLDVREENLVSAIAATIIKPGNISYRLSDITLSIPKDYPTNEKIAKLIATFKKDSHGVFSIL